MSEISRKKNLIENTGEKTFYNINSFRGLNMDRNKQNNEIKINNNNLSSRIIFELNYKHTEKARTTSKNKIIANKMLTTSKNEKSKLINRSILEISYNQKCSPKKLFAETTKKNDLINTQYRNVVINTNQNDYIACFTEDNEMRTPSFCDDKLENNFKKIMSNEKHNGNIVQPGVFYNTTINNRNHTGKTTLNFNYKKQNIQIKPIRINSNLSSRRDIISPINREKDNISKNYLITNINENFDTSLIQNSVNISRTHESFLPKNKKNLQKNEDGKNNNILTEINFKEYEDYIKNRKINNQPKIKLGDGISIKIINSQGEKRIKKFFNIPDFEIYTIKEIPLNNHLIQNINVSQKIKEWNNKMGKSESFVKIHKEFINSPEGYISLVYEYMDGFSLGDIIENFGNLNEDLLQKISSSLLNCLVEYEENFLEDFGEICPCNILFDKYGNLKLNPKILNCCKKELYSLNSENKDNINFFNKCNCYEFFHNSIRNKIRYILREITRDIQINPSPVDNINSRKTSNLENSDNNNKSNYDNNNEIKHKKKDSFSKENEIVENKNNSNTNTFLLSQDKLKDNSNTTTRKNSSLNNNLESEENKGYKLNEITLRNFKNKLRDNILKARKDKLLKVSNEGKIYNKKNNISLQKSISNNADLLNNHKLNNHFNSDKNLTTKLDFETIVHNEFENNCNKNILNKHNFFEERDNIKLNENNKGFSSSNPNGDSANFFNRRSSVNVKNNGKMTLNETNKFLSSNSNGMCDLNKFNSCPNNKIFYKNQLLGNSQQPILHTEINVINNNDDITKDKNKINEIKIDENYPNFEWKKKSSDLDNKNINDNINNNNISNNPNITILNNFIFSSNSQDKKVINEISHDKINDDNITKLKIKPSDDNCNTNSKTNQLSYLNKNYSTSISKKNCNFENSCLRVNNNLFANEDFLDTHSYSQREYNLNDNFFTNNLAITEGNTVNLHNFNSNSSSNYQESQGISETNKNNKNIISKQKLTIDPNKIQNLKINKGDKMVKTLDFPKPYFSIGYIFIIMVCKSIKLKIFEYLDNFSLANLEEVKKYKLNKCCLFHFLISLEEGIKINKNYSIENFFKNYSEEFQNFICNITTISISNRQKTKKKCLKGNIIYNLNAKSLMEHSWIKSEKNFANKCAISKKSHMKISLREVIKIVRESFKTSLIEYNEKKYDTILNKLEVILNNHKNNFNEENIRNMLETKKSIIKKISYDIGINFQEFYNKICDLINFVYSLKG